MQDTEEGKIFTNQTGRFIVPSNTGNNYLLVLYDCDSNFIHAQPMKSRSASEIPQAYKISTKILVRAGLRPQLHNKCSEALKEYMRDSTTTFSSSLRASIVATQQNGQYVHSRITLSLPCAALKIKSLCISGTNCCHKH